MNEVDWIILGAVLLLALLGWAQGFLTGALSLAGFAAGAFAGTRLAPLVLPDGAQSPYAPLFGLFGAVLAGAALAASLEGVGSHLRSRWRSPGWRVADGLLGAVLTAAVGLGLAWVLGAVALQTPGARELRREIQASAVLTRLNDVLPSRELLNALARFDPFPRISGPGIDAKPPDAAIARDPQVRGAADSVVKVVGTACGLGVQGSGWVAEPGVVVTNAHVVAGQDDTQVQAGGAGAELPAQVVHYEPRNDLAVLRVDGLTAPALPLARDPQPGIRAAILGFPGDGPYDVTPARLGQTRQALSEDAYGRGPVRRTITALRGRVRSGNSGGPAVDGRGRVVTTVFAAATSGPTGGYGIPNARVREALADLGGAVSTGPCAR